MSQYMVEINLPDPFPEDFIIKIPEQRQVINGLLETEKLHSYSLSLDRRKLWCIVNGESEYEVITILNEFPLIDYMDYSITELMFHNGVVLKVPAFSIN
jgi:muconolactone delta-isomerase